MGVKLKKTWTIYIARFAMSWNANRNLHLGYKVQHKSAQYRFSLKGKIKYPVRGEGGTPDEARK
jgi:hypothetical protein